MRFLHLLEAVILTLPSILSASIPQHAPVVRKEWIALTAGEKKNYIDAVLCLAKLPSKISSSQIPGAINRRDDFTAVHINQTFGVHLDAVFLGWHRNFLWLYETALRDECGYQGFQVSFFKHSLYSPIFPF